MERHSTKKTQGHRVNKLFLNYPGGASGHLLFRIIAIISRNHTPANLHTYHHLHIDADLEHDDLIIDHDYLSDSKFGISDELFKYCIDPQNVPDEGVEWFKNNFIANDPIKHPFYIYQTHVTNLTPLLLNIPDSKLIYVIVSPDLQPQVCYNFVTKLYPILPDRGEKLIRASIREIQIKYNKLLNLNDINFEDTKLLTWIHWAATLDTLNDRNRTIFDKNIKCLYINYTDMLNKNILNDLDRIAEFLECDKINSEKRKRITNLIDTYIDAQIEIPWNFSLDTYQ